MVKTAHEEKRTHVRAKRILSIRHRLVQHGQKKIDGPWYLSATEDMSYNGILFSSAAPYEVNDILEIEVVMSGILHIFRGYGKVVRVGKKTSGVIYLIAVTLTELKEGKSTKRPARSYLVSKRK